MSQIADWLADKVMSITGGRIKLGGGRNSISLESDTQDPRDHLLPIRVSHDILDGTEDEDIAGVELQDR